MIVRARLAAASSTRLLAASALVILLSIIPVHYAPAADSYEHAVVAADHAAASAAGVEILKGGGNVVDAAVATAFALSVVRPASSGVGGGGFMLIWDAQKRRALSIDYRERAPAAATRDMFVDPRDPTKTLAGASERGHLAAAVPAQVAGLLFALREYGTSDLTTVLAPALRLCRDGVIVDRHDMAVQKEVLGDFVKHPEYRQRFAVLYRLYANGGTPWRPGDRFHSPLTKLLERIAERGADGFYRGEVAEAIVAEMRRGGGLISLEDLQSIQPTVRTALQGEYGAFTIFTMPPPSSGGIGLLETLNILTALGRQLPEAGIDKLAPDSPLFLHVLTESFKHAFADRAAWLGDADYAKVPIQRLTSREYAEKLAAKIDLERTQPPAAYGGHAIPDDGGTSHFSILDAQGNAVACTETINTHFGNYVVEPEFGIVLNNEMDDFTSLPGAPNAFGLVQSEANAIAPGKRPLSSMTPTIAVRDGRAEFVVGASGGPRIITATTQVLLSRIRFGNSDPSIVEAHRIHHQWSPDRLDLEGPEWPAAELEKLGHVLRVANDHAVVQAAGRGADGKLWGASDARKEGRAKGY